jgi:hypothetical protein
MTRRWILVAGLTVAAAVTVATTYVVLRDPPPVVVGAVSGSITLPASRVLLVDFGRVNTSVGDLWSLVIPPDPAVLRDQGQEYDAEPACGGLGCDHVLRWRFDAAAPGTTRLQFQYCYRSRPPACAGEPSRGPAAPVQMTVLVT